MTATSNTPNKTAQMEIWWDALLAASGVTASKTDMKFIVIVLVVSGVCFKVNDSLLCQVICSLPRRVFFLSRCKSSKNYSHIVPPNTFFCFPSALLSVF